MNWNKDEAASLQWYWITFCLWAIVKRFRDFSAERGGAACRTLVEYAKAKVKPEIAEKITKPAQAIAPSRPTYNNTVKREYGGDHIHTMQFPGLSSAISGDVLAEVISRVGADKVRASVEKSDKLPPDVDQSGGMTLLSASAVPVGSVRVDAPLSVKDTRSVIRDVVELGKLKGLVKLFLADSFDALPDEIRKGAEKAGGNKDNTYAVWHKDDSRLIRDAHATRDSLSVQYSMRCMAILEFSACSEIIAYCNSTAYSISSGASKGCAISWTNMIFERDSRSIGPMRRRSA